MTENANMSPILKSLSSFTSNNFDGSLTNMSTATENTQVVEFVQFSEKNHIYRTLSREDYTLEETNATWSSREERQRVSRQCRKEIKKIDNGEESIEDKTFSARGLEGRTKIASFSKAQTRALAINAVLDEQFIQSTEGGVFNEDTIAAVYFIASSPCQVLASVVGQRDHRAAEEIYESLYKKSSAPHHYHDEQTTKQSSKDGLGQSSAFVPRAA
jgi:hypothetical protein